MEVVASEKFIKMSARKARDLARRMCGLPVAKALEITDFNARKGALYLGKTLKSAIANAENNAKLAVDTLWIKDVVVNEGPRIKRHWARARGSVSPIRKRMCHMKIILTDEARGSQASVPVVKTPLKKE